MKKIMIVDDDSTVLAICRAVLGDLYQLTLKKSGLQALGYLKGASLPDLILLDTVMPGLGGLEVLKSLKDDEQFREIPVILMSAESHLEEEIEGYRLGAADYMQKPVNPDLLKMKLKRQMDYQSEKRTAKRLKVSLMSLKQQIELLLSEG